jgi:hypothetical protein
LFDLSRYYYLLRITQFRKHFQPLSAKSVVYSGKRKTKSAFKPFFIPTKKASAVSADAFEC